MGKQIKNRSAQGKIQLNQVLLLVGGTAAVVAGYQIGGIKGLALVGGAVVMWVMLQYTQMMVVMRRAAKRPKGWVASAVMLNAKLQRGMTMLHVVGLANALGDCVHPHNAQGLETWRWTDEGQAVVQIWFVHGKVERWELQRPVASAA